MNVGDTYDLTYRSLCTVNDAVYKLHTMESKLVTINNSPSAVSFQSSSSGSDHVDVLCCRVIQHSLGRLREIRL